MKLEHLALIGGGLLLLSRASNAAVTPTVSPQSIAPVIQPDVYSTVTNDEGEPALLVKGTIRQQYDAMRLVMNQMQDQIQSWKRTNLQPIWDSINALETKGSYIQRYPGDSAQSALSNIFAQLDVLKTQAAPLEAQYAAMMSEYSVVRSQVADLRRQF